MVGSPSSSNQGKSESTVQGQEGPGTHGLPNLTTVRNLVFIDLNGLKLRIQLCRSGH